ncbi:MAG: 23S rRNA (uracil(1939)-C(5))-methyltransferase RlmD [Lachnospiraceae bacterium]|nr:23S rRNA (uracil(1939)-C(5))-methyltransferase RlmD [Lachnospiraceae bacterium]
MCEERVFKKNDIVTVTVTDFGNDGEGIGKADGYTLFIKDAVIGDTVSARIMKVKKGYAYARLLEVITPSPHRTDPPCPVARPCGGCQLQSVTYEEQLHFKRRKVENALRRIGGFSEEKLRAVMQDTEPSPRTLRYRNKMIVPVGTGKDGAPVAGFYAGRTHDIIPCEDCLLGQPENGAILKEILGFMREKGISAYDEESGEGLIRHVFLRRSRESGENMLCLITNGDAAEYARELKARLDPGAHPEWKITGAGYSVNRERTNVIFGGPVRPLWGKAALEDALHSEKYGIHMRYRISPMSFYQVNPYIAEKMYEKVLDLAELTGKETVFDLYCGIGTISLFLASKAREVIGVEIVPDAVKNAAENAALNGLSNARFLEGKAEEVVPALMKRENLRADVVVVDPPRKGCDETLLDTIIGIAPERLIYVSCDPATLARDLKRLTGCGYDLTFVKPYDQFAMTGHVETVCLLANP